MAWAASRASCSISTREGGGRSVSTPTRTRPGTTTTKSSQSPKSINALLAELRPKALTATAAANQKVAQAIRIARYRPTSSAPPLRSAPATSSP